MKRILFILYIILCLWDNISKGNIFALIFLGMLTWCWVKILRTHPGTVPKQGPLEGPEQLKNLCKNCYSWKPPRARHCRHSCKQCIFLYDHHCVWLDQCIGYKNLKYFCQFLFYLSLQSIVSFVPHFLKFVENFEIHQMIIFIHNFEIRNQIMLFVEIIYMFIYATAFRTSFDLLCDKIHHILDGNTYIDQIKPDFPFFSSQRDKFKKQFGHSFGGWFLPLENELNYNYLECLYPILTNDKNILHPKLMNCKEYKAC